MENLNTVLVIVNRLECFLAGSLYRELSLLRIDRDSKKLKGIIFSTLYR